MSRFIRRLAVCVLLALVSSPVFAQAPSSPVIDLDRFLKKGAYAKIRISPTGMYYAYTVNFPDRSVLWVQRRSDGKITAKATGGPHSEVYDFQWVGDERIIIAWAKKDGSLEQPVPTGELFGISADGSGARQLIGHYDATVQADSFVVLSGQGFQYAELIGPVPHDPKHVLVALSSYDIDPVTWVVKMDVDNGTTTKVANAPMRRTEFTADPDGVVRFAEGRDDENYSRLLYRPDAKSDWRTINDERQSGHLETAIGFNANGDTAYLQVQQDEGPDAVVAFDVTTGQRHQALRDPVVDPESFLPGGNEYVKVGASFMGDHRSTAFFDEDSDAAVQQRTLEAAFPEQSVLITSRTSDGAVELFRVDSDTDPGDFYLYDRKTKNATEIFSARDWLDPKDLAPTRQVILKARDGLPLHGYLTMPKGMSGNLPMVVLVHGGPFGIYDDRDFDEEVQILAAAGYAVLRINFRGSGNYGRAFLHAGVRQWGGRMQDDVTDATRWAIAQKIADPKRVCIYGASYGAYSAMMGLAKEPDLYECGVGYVGVYDLPLKLRDDADRAKYLKNWYAEWVGTADMLAAESPVNLAMKIKRPVLLAAGGKDRTAPIEHTQKLEKALIAAGSKPETLYFSTEGHGFYTDEHRRAFYAKLLDFLSANLGGAKARP
jgi:dipeptidyl aminopeptidase/acylaminoacyl peptidase